MDKFCRKCLLQCHFILWRPTWMKVLYNHVRSNHVETNDLVSINMITFQKKITLVSFTIITFQQFVFAQFFLFVQTTYKTAQVIAILSSDIALWFPTSHNPAKCARNDYELCRTRSSSFNVYLIKINFFYAYMEFDILFGIQRTVD